MRELVWGLCLGCAAGVVSAQVVISQVKEAVSPSSDWLVQMQAEKLSVADGLPVLSLDQVDWYRGLSGIRQPSRAAQRSQVGLDAMHHSGWHMGLVGRSQVTLGASADTVELARLNATGQDPASGTSLAVQAQALGWTGKGVTVGTPWLSLVPAWGLRSRLDAQWLQLSKLRQGALSGQVAYARAGIYDAGLSSDRRDIGITGPFLGASDARGWGSSLSLAVEAEPVPGWQIELQADDLWSRLVWGRMARETAVLNTQVTTRAPDGTLDFAPLISGQQVLSRVNEVMGTRWTATLSHMVRHDKPDWGQWNVKWTRWAGMDETWVGWRSLAAPREWQWQLALEPQRHAVAVGGQWRGLRVGLTTDGESATRTRYRQWSVGWSSPM